jgi:hypothetical protein
MTEIRKYEEVKFTIKKKVHYGIVDDQIDRNSVELRYAVEDALLPVVYELAESDLTPVERSKFVKGEGYVKGESDQYIDKEFEKAKEVSDSIEGFGVGSLFSIGVADGSAWYVVTKVNKKTCDVEWRGFCMDRWTDHYFGWGRKRVPIEDVKPYVHRYNGLSKLFGGKKSETK